MAYVLRVEVVQVRNVQDLKHPAVVSSDAYVEVGVGGQHKHTAVVARGELNPIWNQAFEFNLDSPEEVVVFVLWVQHHLGANVMAAHCACTLHALKQGETSSRDLTLRRSGLDPERNGTATISVRLTAMSFSGPRLSSGGLVAKNSAFVFIKPHAVTDTVKAATRKGLEASGIKILTEGSIGAQTIDEKRLIDQHYYSIASKATILKPDQLNVPEAKFQEQFGLSWKDALAAGKVFNAMDGGERLGLNADQLDAAWGAAKAQNNIVKLGGGFYCALLEVQGKEPVYILNGFFMTLRSMFTKPGAEIYYFTVEWSPEQLSWADFRGKVLGPTDPAEAPKDSLRGHCFAAWQELGLSSQPNTGLNCVHASASPLEALAERNNWLGIPVSEDSFGKIMLSEKIPSGTIQAWCVDPQIKIEGDRMGSTFDALEDLDFNSCLEKCVELAKLNNQLGDQVGFVEEKDLQDLYSKYHPQPVPLPIDRLLLEVRPGTEPAVLVACGSFSPPTYMHLRLLEDAKVALEAKGKYTVIGGYLSPVHVAYGKGSLVENYHRVNLTKAAVKQSSWLMVDVFECCQSAWTRTAIVLDMIAKRLSDVHIQGSDKPIRVMFNCGADVLQSMTKVKENGETVWIQDHLRIILEENGVACMAREGTDLNAVIEGSPVLSKHKEHIEIVYPAVSNSISSTVVRKELSGSVKYLAPDAVIEYIREHDLGSKPQWQD